MSKAESTEFKVPDFSRMTQAQINKWAKDIAESNRSRRQSVIKQAKVDVINYIADTYPDLTLKEIANYSDGPKKTADENSYPTGTKFKNAHASYTRSRGRWPDWLKTEAAREKYRVK